MSKKNIVYIDGFKYEIRKMKLRSQWRVFTALSKMLAPALKGIGEGKNPLDVDSTEFSKAFDVANMIAALTEKFDEDEAYGLIEKMLGSVYSLSNEDSAEDSAKKGDGLLDPSKMEIHFDDEVGLMRMLKLTKECIVFNFGGSLKKFKNFKKEDPQTEIDHQRK